MGQKEEGLWQGTLAFMIMSVVSAIVIGQYVHVRTKDRTQADDNRK